MFEVKRDILGKDRNIYLLAEKKACWGNWLFQLVKCCERETDSKGAVMRELRNKEL